MGKSSTPSTSNSDKKGMKTAEYKKSVAAVEEKMNDPVVSKFTRIRPVDVIAKGEGAVSRFANKTDKDFCIQFLVDGYVQSYVDFYHLTNRVDPNSLSTVAKVSVSVEDMLSIRENLIMAEDARRSGDTSGVYNAYNKLADFYTRTSDWSTAVFFHEKCLEVAVLTADMRAEMAANHSLGLVYQQMESYDNAQKFHERHEEIAQTLDIMEELAIASTELYKVYMILAARFEKANNIERALYFYGKSLAASKNFWDKASEGEANGKIGSLLLKTGQASESLPYLRAHSLIAAELGDAEGRCRACSALALALDTVGLADKALAELKLVHNISEQAGDAVLQCKATRALGTLYSKVGKLDEAVQVLQKHFNLLKSLAAKDKTSAGLKSNQDGSTSYVAIVKPRDLDIARVFVGVSRGNLLLGAYRFAIESDLTYLLEWKLTRSELPAPPTK